MLTTARTAERTLVERLVGVSSLRSLLGCKSLWAGRLFISVISVTKLRGTVTRTDRQIRALAAPVAVREDAIQIFRIGWIIVSEPVPAFPQPVDVGVMEIEHRVAADRG